MDEYELPNMRSFDVENALGYSQKNEQPDVSKLTPEPNPR
jgi:hypothetical protein